MGLTAHLAFKKTSAQLSIELLTRFLTDLPKCDFQIQLWDGTTLGAEQPRFILALKHPGALRKMFFSPTELTLGESYIYDDLDIIGDIEAVFQLADHLVAQDWKRSRFAGMLGNLAWREERHTGCQDAVVAGALHSKARDRQAVRYHYDLPSDFFALWLDQRMVYSCAYFASRDESDLDVAQHRKLDYLCRKLRLRPGDRLLDIGCGWGGLVIHAAAAYGVQARGITLSLPQAELARQRIRDSGLEDRCRVDVCDYRDLEVDLEFDRIVSVGMFEHVGEAQLPEYFSIAWRHLRPGGAFLNAGIARSATYERQKSSFIDRYVFPDGDLVPLNTALRAAEKCGFEVRDVESLREHYALTLHSWVRRLEAHADEAKRITDETTYRIWRLYMAGSAYRFRAAQLNLYHILMAKPLHGESGMPLTRADWYRE